MRCPPTFIQLAPASHLGLHISCSVDGIDDAAQPLHLADQLGSASIICLAVAACCCCCGGGDRRMLLILFHLILVCGVTRE